MRGREGTVASQLGQSSHSCPALDLQFLSSLNKCTQELRILSLPSISSEATLYWPLLSLCLVFLIFSEMSQFFSRKPCELPCTRRRATDVATHPLYIASHLSI
jgi:hypothetical protein